MLEFEKNLFVALALLVMGVGCILIGSFVNDFIRSVVLPRVKGFRYPRTIPRRGIASLFVMYYVTVGVGFIALFWLAPYVRIGMGLD